MRFSAPPSLKPDPELPSLPDTVEPRTVFLGGLFLLAVLALCYAAAEIILPIVLAFVLNLVFQPVLRALERMWLPRLAAALVIVAALVALFAALGLFLSGPLSSWIADLPHTLPKLQARLSFLNRAMLSLQSAFDHIQQFSPGARPPTVAVQGPALAERLLASGRHIAGGALTAVLVLFFLLVSGDLFLRRLVEILPGYKEKRQAVDISQQIERDISAYLATITIMNLLVGIATGIAMWLCGLGSAVLWGTLAFLLNFIPILGPTAGFVLFLVTGLVTIASPWLALLPAAFYLTIHLIEGETVTPMLLASRFTVNPVLIVLGVVFWYWMWGVPGAILATPMLAISKIVCDRIDGLKPVGHFIGG